MQIEFLPGQQNINISVKVIITWPFVCFDTRMFIGSNIIAPVFHRIMRTNGCNYGQSVHWHCWICRYFFSDSLRIMILKTKFYKFSNMKDTNNSLHFTWFAALFRDQSSSTEDVCVEALIILQLFFSVAWQCNCNVGNRGMVNINIIQKSETKSTKAFTHSQCKIFDFWYYLSTYTLQHNNIC